MTTFQQFVVKTIFYLIVAKVLALLFWAGGFDFNKRGETLVWYFIFNIVAIVFISGLDLNPSEDEEEDEEETEEDEEEEESSDTDLVDKQSNN